MLADSARIAVAGAALGPIGSGDGQTGAGARAADRSPETVSAVFFRAGGVLFAACAEHVEEIQRAHGEPAPAVDLAAEVGRRGERELVLVLRVDTRRVRVSIDGATEVAAVPLADIYPLPPLVAAGMSGGYVEGLVVRGEELAILLDAPALARIGDERSAGSTTEVE